MSESNGHSSEQGGAGRNEKGRWLPGVSGNPGGRARSIDFRALIAEHRGVTREEALLRVYDKLVALSEDGDVAAIKLLLERLCEPVTTKLEHGGEVTLRELVREASRLANAPPEVREDLGLS